MDDISSEYEKAVAIGQENLELLRLADAWCQNVSYTRGPFGIGIIEASTGLPISGGEPALRLRQATAELRNATGARRSRLL